MALHNQPNDTWLIIGTKVYDISHWVTSHPGGDIILSQVAGKDCSDPFYTMHTEAVARNYLPKFHIGDIHPNECKLSPMQQDLRDIMAKIEEEGLYDTDISYYYKKYAAQCAMLIISLICAFYGRHLSLTSTTSTFSMTSSILSLPLFYYLLSAVSLGFFWQQLAFLGHDFGHNSVYGSSRADWIGSFLVTVFFGVSGQWWKRNHNVHHVHTNSVESDPDIQHLPVFAVSNKLFKKFFSTYYRWTLEFNPIAQILVSYQHVLYYPVMAIARLNLYMQSFLLVLNPNMIVRWRLGEIVALCCYWILFSSYLSIFPDLTSRALVFFLSHAVAGLTHVQITLSHFGLPLYNGAGYEADDPDYFIRTQFCTTMDVDCYTWLDWLHGGLQFQVEHHLLPRVPRHHLRYVREQYVIPFAKKHGLPFHNYPFFDCNIKVFHTMKEAAMQSRKHPSKLSQSPIWQFIMADG